MERNKKLSNKFGFNTLNVDVTAGIQDSFKSAG